jgi:hypothetical protein
MPHTACLVLSAALSVQCNAVQIRTAVVWLPSRPACLDLMALDVTKAYLGLPSHCSVLEGAVRTALAQWISITVGCALEIKRQAVAEERNALPRASSGSMWQDMSMLYAALQGVLYAAFYLVT